LAEAGLEVNKGTEDDWSLTSNKVVSCFGIPQVVSIKEAVSNDSGSLHAGKAVDEYRSPLLVVMMDNGKDFIEPTDHGIDLCLLKIIINWDPVFIDPR